jgi:hypothetical protein
MGSCPLSPDINIGDYENQLEEWNRQNMLDYKLILKCTDFHGGGWHTTKATKKQAVITVRNGIPESGDPPEWLTGGEMSTVPEIFSFIKEEEKRLKDINASRRLIVKYNNEYHHPRAIQELIIGNNEPFPVWIWTITLTPSGENEQETGNGEE